MPAMPQPKVPPSEIPTQSDSVVPQFKNRLQEYAQKAAIPLPLYQTINEGTPHAPMFRSTVVFSGATYTSPNFFVHRKSAEMDAARICLLSLAQRMNEEKSALDQEDNNICKSILNEYAVKINVEKPIYKTEIGDGLRPAFVSSLTFNGKHYVGDEGRNKKVSQQLAARAAILSILDSDASTVISKIIFNLKKKLSAAKNKVKYPCETQNEVMPVGIQKELNVGTGSSKGNELNFVVVNDNMSRTAIVEPCTGNLTTASAKPVGLHEFRLPKGEASLVEANGTPITFMPPNSEQLVVASTSVTKRKRKSTTAKNKVGIDAQVQIAAVPSSVVVNDNMPRAATSGPCSGNSTSVSANSAFLHEFRLPKDEASLVEANDCPIIFMPPDSEKLAVDSTSAKKRKRKSKKSKNKVGIDAEVQIAAVPLSVVVNDSMPRTATSEPCTGNFTSVSAKSAPLHEFRLPKQEALLVEANDFPIIILPPNSELAVDSTSAKKRKRESKKSKNKVGIDAKVQIAAVPSSVVVNDNMPKRATSEPCTGSSTTVSAKLAAIAAVPSSQTTTCTLAQSVPNNCVSLQGFDNAVLSGSCDLPERSSESETHVLVYWRKPADGFIALNTDGASQNGIAAGGGIFRNHNGEHLSNFYNKYGRGPSSFAESKAILDGLRVCKELGYNKIQLQIDSAVAALWFQRKTTVPLHMQTIWNEIYKLQDSLSIEFLKIYRQGNKMADYLSKKGILADGMGAINISLDERAKDILTADRMGISFLRKLKPG